MARRGDIFIGGPDAGHKYSITNTGSAVVVKSSEHGDSSTRVVVLDSEHNDKIGVDFTIDLSCFSFVSDRDFHNSLVGRYVKIEVDNFIGTDSMKGDVFLVISGSQVINLRTKRSWAFTYAEPVLNGSSKCPCKLLPKGYKHLESDIPADHSFKRGDIIIGNSNANKMYSFTKEGCILLVSLQEPGGKVTGRVLDNPSGSCIGSEFTVESGYFNLFNTFDFDIIGRYVIAERDGVIHSSVIEGDVFKIEQFDIVLDIKRQSRHKFIYSSNFCEGRDLRVRLLSRDYFPTITPTIGRVVYDQETIEPKTIGIDKIEGLVEVVPVDVPIKKSKNKLL